MNNIAHIILVISLITMMAIPVYGMEGEIKVTMEWESGKLMKWTDEAWGIATYDFDGDGVKDLIVPVTGNNVSVISGVTHKEITRFQVTNDSFLSYLFNYAFVAQMDKDSNKELVLGAMGLLLGNIFVVDMKTHEVQLHLSTIGGCMSVYDVDGDGASEIITATNHVEIYRVGSNSPIYKSANMSGSANAITETTVGGKRVLFVASVKTESTGYTEFEYHSRIYEFSLPDLKMTLNISAGNQNVHAIAAGDINGDGKTEILVGSDKITAYSTDGSVIWETPSLGSAINNIKIADLLNNGQKYMVIALDNVEIWNLTSKEVIWQSETLYDVGEAGGLLVTKLSANETTKIITRTYAYSEGGRVYEYSVGTQEVNGNANSTGNSTSAGGAGWASPENPIVLYGAIIATVSIIILAVAVIHLKKKGNE